MAEKEGADMLRVTTRELCRALGKSGETPASLEEVKAYVCELLPILEEAGFSAVCGCGFLALQVVPLAVRDRAFEEGRDLKVFTPEDLDAYLNDI
jgi:hypothetical protein